MGLADIKKARLSDLSGGQRQRAWIALALAQNTDFIFLDEPTNHLDLKYQIEILELLKTLNREDGRTIVMVLHDINHAVKYADYIIALKDGTIYAEGEKSAVITEETVSSVYDIRCRLVNVEDDIICIPYGKNTK